MQYLWKLLLKGESPVKFRELVRWWGTEPATRSRIFPYGRAHLFLFGKKGFTRGCAEAAGKRGNVTLVSYMDLLKKIME